MCSAALIIIAFDYFLDCIELVFWDPSILFFFKLEAQLFQMAKGPAKPSHTHVYIFENIIIIIKMYLLGVNEDSTIYIILKLVILINWNF